MGRAEASITVPGRAADAEALWYDPQRWQAWVDGGHPVSTEPVASQPTAVTPPRHAELAVAGAYGAPVVDL